jgi:DNA-binding transcriptional ArsR family regulator
MGSTKLPLSEKMLELVARRFKLLGEPLRLRILQVLESGETTVNDIVQALEANQSNVSKHLALLYDGGLVGRRRDRNSIYYFIADPVVLQLCALVCHSAGEDARTTLAELTQPRRYATTGKGKGRA